MINENEVFSIKTQGRRQLNKMIDQLVTDLR